MFSCLARSLSPLRLSPGLVSPRHPPPFLLARNLHSRRYGRSNVSSDLFEAVSKSKTILVGRRGKFLQTLNLSGKKIVSAASVLSLSMAAGGMYARSTAAHAMSDYHADSGENAQLLKKEINRFWSIMRKIQLPLLFTMTVFFGWRHPIALLIDVALLLFCTRPNPLSIYFFIEQMLEKDMHLNLSLYQTKLLYLKKVEVHDYKLLCLARVELRHKKMYVVGVLGEWFAVNC